MKLLVGTFLGLLALGAPASAEPVQDFYVDAVHGDDANSGTTPADAWRTLTHASNTAQASIFPQTIFVAPGTHDQALGETFPIVIHPPDVTFVSTAGPAATIVDGGGTAAALFALRQPYSDGAVRIEGFTLRDADRGVHLWPQGGACTADLVDLEVTGMTDSGINAHADHHLTVRLERVRSTGNARGLTGYADYAQLQLTATDCDFSDNVHNGASISGGGPVDIVFDLESCRLERNGGVGVSASCHVWPAGYGFVMGLTGCLVADNAAGGGQVSGNINGSSAGIAPVRTTFARNGPFGLRVGPRAGVNLDSCILVGHTSDFDVQLPALVQAQYSMLHDRSLEGVNGNIGGFPMFVDPAAGDYRLLPGSPCIDAGNPALALDPDGTRADMGAFPFDQGGPTTYCSGKPSSLGCVPFLATAGSPSASGTGSFLVEAHDVLPDQAGVLVYGFAPGSLPFHGGTLCVKAPLRRLGATAADASGPPPCAGILRRNFNQVVQNGSDPLLTAGQVVYAQWRQRDPLDPAGFGDSLSNGVTFSIGP